MYISKCRRRIIQAVENAPTSGCSCIKQSATAITSDKSSRNAKQLVVVDYNERIERELNMAVGYRAKP